MPESLTKVLTIVPMSIAQNLSDTSRVQNFNSLPQLSEEALGIISDYVTETVGYSNLPIACLAQPEGGYDTSFTDYLPVNSKDSVLFSLEMPNDMIVSVDYTELLDISKELHEETDVEEKEYLKDSLKDALFLGIGENRKNIISFIPFLDYNRCKFYATFSSNFAADKKFKIPGLTEMNLRELKYFNN